MSAEVLLGTYGHHHPDFFRGAASAITTKPKQDNVFRWLIGGRLEAYGEKRRKSLMISGRSGRI